MLRAWVWLSPSRYIEKTLWSFSPWKQPITITAHLQWGNGEGYSDDSWICRAYIVWLTVLIIRPAIWPKGCYDWEVWGSKPAPAISIWPQLHQDSLFKSPSIISFLVQSPSTHTLPSVGVLFRQGQNWRLSKYCGSGKTIKLDTSSWYCSYIKKKAQLWL